jgi:hypothetical protein
MDSTFAAPVAVQNSELSWPEVMATNAQDINNRLCNWLNARSYDVYSLEWRMVPENSFISVEWNTDEDTYNGQTNEGLFTHSMLMARLIEEAVCEWGPREAYEREIRVFEQPLPDVPYVNALVKTLCAFKVVGGDA